MALTSRRLHREEEEESVFVSMTDLMISILFVVMIVMAFFVKSYQEDVPHITNIEKQLANLREENERLGAQIVALQKKLDLTFKDAERLEALRVKNSALEEMIAALEIKEKELEADVLRLEGENHRLEGIIADRDKTIAELLSKITEVEKEVKRLEKELAALKERLREADPLAEALSGISEDKRVLLGRLEQRLIDANIRVIVDEVSGVVRFGEDAVQFASGKSEADLRSQNNMRKIADILSEELVCYTLGPSSEISIDCNPNSSIIEAVQIEGHTDTDGSVPSNLVLSTQRATSTYEVMAKHREVLEGFLNASYLLDEVPGANGPGQQVLSVSGYGETRPVAHGESEQDKRANRRIDIRFIMTTPRDIEEVERLKDVVRQAVEVQRGTQ